MSAVRRVAVLGAGTMGHGIAQVAAQAGYETVLYDLTEALVSAGLEKVGAGLARVVEKGKLSAVERDAVLARLRGETDLAAAVREADLVIEAAPERLEIKQELFRQLGRLARPEAVLATNTSSLPVTEIAAAAARPERVIGLHFFNPPPVMALLEIVTGERTSPATLETARAVGQKMGKELVVVRDSPGFASSRLGIALALEAIRMVETGVAAPEDIDRAMEHGYRHPMGPLRLTDLVGLDVRLSIAEFLYRELGTDTFRPPQLLRRMVRAGKLGKKSGQGFYRWE